ncbi:carboxypeptidase S [Hortaea werneckii]|nr:carboxypeptidase S [Hortaea werneckii]
MSAALTTDVDKRLLRTTKFPPEFSKKVDTTKVKREVITTWAAGELKRILGDVDEILSGLVSGFIEDNRFPNIKAFQISLTGFLDKETPDFCQHLWNLLLSAQESETGVPKELLEAKKTELINERLEEERQRKEAQKKQDAEREHERNMARIRERERGHPNRRGRETPLAVHEPFAIPRSKPAETQTQEHTRPLALPVAQETLQQLAIPRARRQPSQSETTTNDELKRRGSEPHDQPAKRPRNTSSVGIEDKSPTNSGAEYKEESGFSFLNAAARDPNRWVRFDMPGASFEWQLGHRPPHSGRITTFRGPAPASPRNFAVPKPRELFPEHRGGTIRGDTQPHRLGFESHQAANQQPRAVLLSHGAPMNRFMPSVVPPTAPALSPTPAFPYNQEQPLSEREMQEKKKKFITQRNSGWYPSLNKRKDSFNEAERMVALNWELVKLETSNLVKYKLSFTLLLLDSRPALHYYLLTMEKSLPLPVEHQAPRPAKSNVRRYFTGVLIIAATLYWTAPLLHSVVSNAPCSSPRDYNVHSNEPKCSQPAALFPSTDNDALNRAYDFLSTDDFKQASIKRHSGAVQIPTESFDDMRPVGKDKRWDTRFELHKYLANTFPRMHKSLKVEKVNTFGLVYTWQGSDASLKPLVLMAHQDVVPVPASTVDAWTHPPFSGFYDGQFIWGRGSIDCKNQLIAEMEVLEGLLEAGFEPRRSIVLSFGFDEEISGTQGAGKLAEFLLQRYGRDGVAALVDEGAGMSQMWGTTFAMPGIGEKGYTDVHITIRMPGGHSSIPVDHTSIGVMSELITAIEAQQYPTYLADDNPILGLLQCSAEHAPEFPSKLKKLLDHRSPSLRTSPKPDHLALEAAKLGRPIQYLMQTSQAVDVIQGGAKVNALPERTAVTINHRINIGDTPEDVYTHLTSLARPVAKKYNLNLHAFDGVSEADNSISLFPSNTTLRVAPVTPSTLFSDEEQRIPTPYSILAATTRALYGSDMIVSPAMMTGNTDTRYYWDLTRHIFRYGPGYDPDWIPEGGLGRIHTVDEKVSVVNHVNMVKWFWLFVRNMDGVDVE